MAVRQRGGSWQADVQREGKRHRETFDTEREALAWEHAARDALKKGKALPGRNEPKGAYGTIEDLVRVVKATKWNKPGAHQMCSAAARFVAFVGPRTPTGEALTQENVDRWITEDIAPREVTGGTINRHLSAISVMVKRALAAGLIPRKLDLSWQAESEARLRFFSEDEEALVLQTFRLWSLERWADFLIVLMDTGGRTWAELGSAKWTDLTQAPRMVTFWDTKNGDSRAVPLTTRAWEAINRQPRTAEGPFTDLGKETGRAIWDRLRVHLPQLQDTVWYTARHTFASRLVQRGVDLYRVQKLLGHRDPKMTQRYAKLAPTHLIDAIQVLERAA